MNRHKVIPFTLRYMTVHTLTYLSFGIFFMLISQYFEYFKSDPIFYQVMKPSDALSVRIEGFLYTKFSFNPLIGYPEIGLQMLVFWWMFCRWQNKRVARNEIK